MSDLLPGCDTRCRGCDHRHLSAAQSEAQKAQWLREALAPWRDLIAPMRAVEPAARIGYRDRVRLGAGWEKGEWRIGLCNRDKTITPTHDCPVESARVRATLAALRPALPSREQFPLHWYVQTGAQVTLVVKSARVTSTNWLSDDVQSAAMDAGVEGVWLHLFPSAGRQVFSKNGWQLLWGSARSVDELGLQYGPTAFSQLLPALYRASLDEAETFLDPQAGDLVFDLYCGRGATIRRWLARKAQVLGVEAGGEAVGCARLNAPGATVLRGLCAQRVPQLEAAGRAHGRPSLLYVNPPRVGLEPEVRRWIGTTAYPSRIAYLSCSAGTLRRDLTELVATGYGVKSITPYDFFPRTRHVETLALLELGNR